MYRFNLLTTLFALFFCTLSISAKDISSDFKKYLETEYPDIVFKIDNSFTFNGSTYLPLYPNSEVKTEALKTDAIIPDKKDPKLFLFSNGLGYARLIKNPDQTTTIITKSEVPKEYKERFSGLSLPSDLVVPRGFKTKDKFITSKITSLKSPSTTKKGEKKIREIIDNAKVTIEQAKTKTKKDFKQSKNKPNDKSTLKGTLYLTSPGSGEIINLDLQDTSIINRVKTKGLPYEISSDSKELFITNLAKNEIYKLSTIKGSSPTTLKLPAMTKPKDIKTSSDGSIYYILDSNGNKLLVFNNLGELMEEVDIPVSSSYFSILKEKDLIAITCQSLNKIVFLNLNSFEKIGEVKISGGPAKIISDSSYFYVAKRNENKISIINPITKKEMESIEVGRAPTSLILHPKKNWIYIGNGKSDTISVVDLDNKKLINEIKLPACTQFPSNLVITSNGNWLISTSESTSKITIFDLSTNKPVKKVDVGTTTHSAYIIE